jgi:hypothetical protein
MGIMSAALVTMGRFYGLPATAAGCTSDAPEPGPEAVIEKLVTMLPPASAGADILVGFGEIQGEGERAVLGEGLRWSWPKPFGSVVTIPIGPQELEIKDFWFEVRPEDATQELAKMRGIQNGDKVIIESARGKLEAVAMVTIRFRPFQIQGTTVHEVGLPWHFGWVHPKDGGDSANLLTPSTGDPNTRIPESKAFMVNVTKA